MVYRNVRFIPSPPQTICFSTGVEAQAQAILALAPRKIMHRLIVDQESEAVLYAGLQLVEARLTSASNTLQELQSLAVDSEGQIAIGPLLAELRDRSLCLHGQVQHAIASDQRLRQLVLTERAAIIMVAGCWLDGISQPATQPDRTVNILFGQHFRYMGEARIEASSRELRRRALNAAGVELPAITDESFGAKANICDSTALFVAFYLGLSRFAANFLPEVLGVHVAYNGLGLDSALLSETACITVQDLTVAVEAFTEGLVHDGNRLAQVERFLRAVAITVDMEQRHAGILIETAKRAADQSLDARVAELIAQHAKMAGKHHDAVQIARRPMADYFAGDAPDLQSFMQEFRKSPRVRIERNGSCRFLNALKFGGPMFGIFTESEARLLTDWVETLPETRGQPLDLTSCRPHDQLAASDLEHLRATRPDRARIDDHPAGDERELFYRLVNIENFPNTLAEARARLEQGLLEARQLFVSDAEGRYTDGRFFAYSAEALLARVESVYEKKLIGPYQRLEDIPARDDVVFEQKTFALGNLIDGSWSWRIGNLGRYEHCADARLFAIHADEMGLGDYRKNHITLIHDVLDSMGVCLPHIADPAFRDQFELPDTVYPFAINQLALALFADSYYPEIVGYNLGIEMFGLGEMRLHEIQKLRHHGFSTIYEEVHLSIDNISSGHARQSIEIVSSYLEYIRRTCGEALMHRQWERIWNGYCVFAHFIESGPIVVMQVGTTSSSVPPSIPDALGSCPIVVAAEMLI
ncbi:hypothetical protein AAKU61_003827 [Undibacterium sp. GrIS 1.2]